MSFSNEEGRPSRWPRALSRDRCFGAPLPIEAPASSRSPFAGRQRSRRTETGDYNLGVEADGFFRMSLDGKEITIANGSTAWRPSWAACIWKQGKPAQAAGGVWAGRQCEAMHLGWCGRRWI
jgi:hypothetical protein